ncbi:MAG: hypothetical protein ACNA7W_15110 [Pseudomonadales bacterium]
MSRTAPSYSPPPAAKIHCYRCRHWLPATEEHWTPSVLSGRATARCRTCQTEYYREHKQTLQEKKYHREKAIRRLDVWQLQAMLAEHKTNGTNAPAYIFERLTIELNRLRSDPAYAAEVLARAPS